MATKKGDGESTDGQRPYDPVAYIDDVAAQAGVADEVVASARRVVAAYSETGQQQGRLPRGVAAGGLLAVLEARNANPDIMAWEDPAGVSHPTLRKRLDEMREFVDAANVDAGGDSE